MTIAKSFTFRVYIGITSIIRVYSSLFTIRMIVDCIGTKNMRRFHSKHKQCFDISETRGKCELLDGRPYSNQLVQSV